MDSNPAADTDTAQPSLTEKQRAWDAEKAAKRAARKPKRWSPVTDPVIDRIAYSLLSRIRPGGGA